MTIQNGISSIASTLKKYAIAFSCAGFVACSHSPVQSTSAAPVTPAVAQTEQVNRDVGENSAVAANDSNGLADSTDLIEPADSEPKTAEEAVAIAVAEQDLLDRIRAGFAMTDVENSAIDREIAWFARHDDYLDRTFRRAERYLFFIVEELEARKMPLELALLPIVESAFNPGAISRARAAGLWQFIPSTGRRFGLEQNHSYDGRRDVMESTRAALDYLQFLANEFDGDWQQAVAAYNCGELNVSRAIARNRAAGRPTDFFSLALPRETRAYVPKLLAMRRIVAQPEKYGLDFGHIANQRYFAKVEFDAPIDLSVAAKLANLPKEDLIALNPAHQRAIASGKESGYLLVPVDRAEQLSAGLAALRSPSDRVPNNVPKIHYTVHRGDTVSSVARKLGVSSSELAASNGVKSNALHVGQELIIERGASPMRAMTVEPPPTQRVVTRDPTYIPPPLPPRQKSELNLIDRHTVREGETLWSIARKYGVSLNALAAENKLSTHASIAKGQRLWIPGAREVGTATLAANTPVSSTVQPVTYIVRAGDTLMRIAKSFRVEIQDLMSWNKLTSAHTLKAGQKLVMYFDDTHRSGG
jgi:membrane-bound lytic murein transglycosylase D